MQRSCLAEDMSMPALRGVASMLGAVACASALASAPASAQSDWCRRLAPRLPDVSQASCERSGVAPGGAVSRKGFPILVREIPADAVKPGTEPVRVLLLGGIHGDELTSMAIVFQWLEWMQGPVARSIHWKVAPVVNPDGMLARRPQRMNAGGVDLNRNFPTPNWEQDAPRYWKKQTRSDPRRFPGHAPLSEPESRWLDAEMARFKPHVIVSVHAPFGVLDFDGPAPVPRRFGLLNLNQVGVYPGSLGNYSGVHKNVPVITIELPNALKMPPEKEARRIWYDMLTWIGRNLPAGKTDKVEQADASRRMPTALR
jgi:hypothetical protein